MSRKALIVNAKNKVYWSIVAQDGFVFSSYLNERCAQSWCIIDKSEQNVESLDRHEQSDKRDEFGIKAGGARDSQSASFTHSQLEM